MKVKIVSAVLLFSLAMAGCKSKTAENAAAPPDQSAAAQPAPAPDQAATAQPSASAQPKAAAQPAPPPATGPTPAAAAPVAPPPPPPPPIIPAGTSVTARLSTTIGSKINKPGDTFNGTTTNSIRVKGSVLIPAGSAVSGVIVDARERGRIKGEGELDLRLTAINVRGHSYPIETAVLNQTLKGKGKRTAVTTGGGAGLGALIGGLAGGGKGALIGAGAGAGAGLAGGIFTGNKQIEVPAETPLTFTLSSSLRL